MLCLTVSVTGTAGDGVEKSGTPWGPRNGGWLCCQSQLPKSIPCQAPQMGQNKYNLPAAFPFPSHNRSILPKEQCHCYPGDAGGCSSPVHESRHPKDPVPKLEPLSHPELSLEGCREQVSKATAVNSPPQSGLYKPSRFRGWMRSLPGTGALFAEGTHHFEIHPALPGCQRAAPALPRGHPRHHRLYFTVTALPRARGCK